MVMMMVRNYQTTLVALLLSLASAVAVSEVSATDRLNQQEASTKFGNAVPVVAPSMPQLGVRSEHRGHQQQQEQGQQQQPTLHSDTDITRPVQFVGAPTIGRVGHAQLLPAQALMAPIRSPTRPRGLEEKESGTTYPTFAPRDMGHKGGGGKGGGKGYMKMSMMYYKGMGMMSKGKGMMSKGKGMMSKGKGMMSKGKGMMSKGMGMMSKGKGMMSKGTGMMSKGMGMMSKGKGMMSKGTGMMSKGQGMRYKGKGSMMSMMSKGKGKGSKGKGGKSMMSKGKGKGGYMAMMSGMGKGKGMMYKGRPMGKGKK